VGQHTLGELLDVLVKMFLGDRRGWSGSYIVHLETRLDEHRLRHLLTVASRVDVTRHTCARQRRRELPDIDVHAPAVARARLYEW
jgi:hypothetical protein